ncbi:oxysterol-binding protein-related protein 1-like isoform X2 [Pelodiscus sinensis]|uniref:oxysterol-binding protein-related protein 1-like isoform X2 n=1 Tax=Pelodiscus sinensis TaxID=13735 RepID=UPI003F6AEF0B
MFPAVTLAQETFCPLGIVRMLLPYTLPNLWLAICYEGGMEAIFAGSGILGMLPFPLHPVGNLQQKELCALYGKWTECLYSVDAATFDALKKNDKKNTEEKKNLRQVGNSEEPDEMPLPDSESVHVIPGSILLWRIAPRPPDSVQMYNFTSFAMALNELDKEMESVVPKTDCRLRPDIRAMENGEIVYLLESHLWKYRKISILHTTCASAIIIME